MGIVHTALRLKPHQLLIIPEAIWLSGWYRFRILYRPFSELSAGIGKLGQETPMEEEKKSVVKDVCWAMEAVGKRMPWTCNCMVRALTVKQMLHRRGLDTTLYMGVAPAEQGGMEAHAWLRCGTAIVTGRSGMERFTVTTVYGPKNG